MASRIAEIVLTVKIPVSDYRDVIEELLDEIKSVAQVMDIAYEGPEVRHASA